jgi:hypothetical protein
VPKPANIVDLEQRYKALEDEIAEALTHKSADDLIIVDLKRRLLHLRDETFRLRMKKTLKMGADPRIIVENLFQTAHR